MPKYCVVVTRDVTESVTVEVEADDEHSAEIAALEKVWNAEDPPEWELDDEPSSSEPYTNGADLIA